MRCETYDGRMFEFDPHIDGWIPHNYEETKHYDSFFPMEPDWTVVELGAWLGLFTLWTHRRVRDVYAVEPHPGTFERLKNNPRRLEPRDIPEIIGVA